MKKYILIPLLTFGGLFLISCSNSRSSKGNDTSSNSDTANVIAYNDSILNSLHICTELPFNISEVFKDGESGIGGDKMLMWPKSKKTLNVLFLDGDLAIQEKVKNVAKEWEDYQGITFNFESNANPDITISFLQNGSWSYIGTSSVGKKPSMNFGWLTLNTDDEEYSRVVLHEFGHALGLIHEHQNPNNNPIKWNKELVYRYYMRPPNNWSKEEIDNNLFAKYEEEEINGSSFDSTSIMLYSFPKELTLDGFHTNWNTQLSKMDKKYIGILYPKNYNNVSSK